MTTNCLALVQMQLLRNYSNDRNYRLCIISHMHVIKIKTVDFV